MKKIRKTVIAGSWYPVDPNVLRKDIKHYFRSAVNAQLTGEILAIIAPHAGYIFSGQIAAHAYNLIGGKKYDTVIVIGPSHRVAFHGVSIYSKGGYETPLGIVPVEEDVANKILSLSNNIHDLPEAHLHEHSIEIQLPFLQVALGEFSFVPLIMGDQNESICRELAETLHNIAREKRILVVGSSDLSHFHDYHQAVALDNIALKCLENADAEGLLKKLSDNSTEACGGGPMAVAMLTAKKMGATKAKVLKYANSADITSDKSSVVGYVSAVYYQ